MKRRTLRTLPLLAALAALPLAGCVNDQQLDRIAGPELGGDLFRRYVALGNSITAGFQSAGINDSTQIRAYPVLLARQANAPFYVPLLNRPGCPPPFTTPFGPVRVGDQPGQSAPACSLRANQAPGTVQNLAVPGAQIADALNSLRSTDATSTFNRLQTFFLGGRSQVQAMVDAQPTLVSAWLGNNDALGAALSGNLAALTPLADFNASLDALVAAIRTTPAADRAVLIGPVNANVVPLLQPGAFFFLARDPVTGRFQGKPVNPNCSPVDLLGQPNPLSRSLISFEMVGNASFPEINCADDAYPAGDPRRGAFVLSVQEQGVLAQRVTEYNAATEQRAAANGWVYLNPNTLLAPFLVEKDAQGRYQRIRKCQELATATNAAAFQAAVLNSCPVTGPTAAPNFFGSLISLDGFHPSSQAHQIIANALATAINERYQTRITTR
ncbi:MAG: hypothetical protein M3409_09600 [Gemmatimonadota bacterium]|nr:hypothetical protein [Gemmatimonadota bacterium]